MTKLSGQQISDIIDAVAEAAKKLTGILVKK